MEGSTDPKSMYFLVDLHKLIDDSLIICISGELVKSVMFIALL